MLNRLQKLRDQKDGFTIIEVLIVLAIAGLIMVVVFLAVPNLQKSQRNNARDTDANNMLQGVSAYIGNSNGNLPAACSTLAACTWITYKPQQLTTVDYSVLTSTPAATATVAKDTAHIYSKAVCDSTGITPTTTGATSRDYVIWYGIEGSTGKKCTQGS